MDRPRHTRRAFLAGLSAVAAGPVMAAPALTSRPPARPRGLGKVASLERLIGEARLSGKVSAAVADASTGKMLEVRAPFDALPPASTAKAVTALYALDRLGPTHQFSTRLIGTGPVRNGQLDGDLVLVGGCDPTLDTDGLAALVDQLKAAGVVAVGGRFVVATGQVPVLSLIDPGQPDHVGYNPAVAGLNLNFNRVHFEWKREASGYAVTMQARTGSHRPSVSTARMVVEDRSLPIYTYEERNGIDHWSVARGALGQGGSRWLPVRDPVAYSADVFGGLARLQGIALRAPVVVSAPPEGRLLAEHVSDDLAAILKGMLKYSTNLTAEVVGQSACLAGGVRPSSLRTSAGDMSAWLQRNTAARNAAFVDHSGLGDQSDATAHDMIAALQYASPDGALSGLLKPWHFRTADGGRDRNHPVRVLAKTGTLNFVSALTGFILPPNRRPMAFAILTADEAHRATIPREQRERPPGARTWASRSRNLQDKLLKRWASGQFG